MTQTALAKRIGFVRNYISIIENGKEPSHRFIRALELLEQGPVQYNEHSELVRDEEYGAARRSLVVEPGRSGVALRVIPLLSWAQAGTAEAWTDLEGREGFVGFNVEDPKAVAVRIRGDGMEPRFPQGTIAIVYPGWEAKSRDLVIARLKDGTVIFARLHVDGNHYTFISLNEIYPPLTVEKSKVEKVLPVGGTYQSHL
jgi:SOS-response transcriptional repressor LexA